MGKVNEATTTRLLYLLSSVTAAAHLEPHTVAAAGRMLRSIAQQATQHGDHEAEVFAAFAEMCELACASAANVDESPAFQQQDFGAQLPHGCIAREAVCRQCGARRLCTSIRLDVSSVGVRDITPACAECVHDFIAGAKYTSARVFGLVKRRGQDVYAEIKEAP